MTKINFSDPFDFEKAVLFELQRADFEAELAPKNTRGYDIVARKGDQVYAVQVKNLKTKISVPYLQKFEAFLEMTNEIAFTGGLFICANGFSKPAYAHYDTSEPEHIHLATYTEGQLHWYPNEAQAPNGSAAHQDTIKNEKRRYIGVFTCKGGVGKTTVSAHLAGAFALCGYDTVLIDLDQQGNLRKLLNEGVYLPSANKSELGTQITVINHDEWDPQAHDEKIVVCDCNPELENNPAALVEQFDYCIIPTTLNPLGINKNADVIQRTLEGIRAINPRAELFVLINNYYQGEDRRNKVLNNILKSSLEKNLGEDSKFFYIDPLETDIAIRHSTQLLYWGYDSLIEGSEPQLGFKYFGGRSAPRSDFLALANYIEDHTDLETFKNAA